MAVRNSIAIDITQRRLRVVHVARSGDGLRVENIVATDVPPQLDQDDAQSIGVWLGEQLSRAGIPRSHATFAMSREHVSLKRLTLPTDDIYELPDMVRLSMHRDIPFDPEEAVIDFIPIEQHDGESIVLVAAIRIQLVKRIQQISKAAGIKVERISLRCIGMGALLRTLTSDIDKNRAWLGVDVTGDSVEISVMTDGNIRFSRAAEIAQSESAEKFAETAVMETRRSWMSYRVVENAPEISEVFVLGDRKITREMINGIAGLMDVRVESLDRHPLVNDGGCDLISTWPLVGLLLEPIVGGESFDFAKPREAPDRYARVRQIALSCCGALLLGVVACVIFGNQNLRNLNQQAEDKLAKVTKLADGHWQYKRDVRRLEHLDRWEEAHADWLEHLLLLQQHLPPQDKLILENWSGSLRTAEVLFNSKAAKNEPEWSVSKELVITLEGEAKNQKLIDAFRKSFVDSTEYDAKSLGPDTSKGGKRYPIPFKLTLRTTKSTPFEQKEDGAPSDNKSDSNEAGDETQVAASKDKDGGNGT